MALRHSKWWRRSQRGQSGLLDEVLGVCMGERGGEGGVGLAASKSRLRKIIAF